ncbi:MAG: C39 family peptidase [Elusimicrobiales bacterium]|nr:C39 family peptidase [Elusimicrobiales bacterium]
MNINKDDISRVSRNFLVVEPKNIEIVYMDNFEKGNRLDMFRAINVGKKSEIRFKILSDFYFNQFILSVSPYMNDSNTMSVFCDFNSKRYYLGNFSVSSSKSFPLQDEEVKVDIDVLCFKNRISSLDAGIIFWGNGKKGIKLVNLIMTDTDKRFFYENFFPKKYVNIDIPKISQISQGVEYNTRICSPTCISMVLKYYNFNIDPVCISKNVYDNSSHIYGNWFFNTAYVSYLGFYSFVARINSYSFLYKILSKEIPVIATISFDEGELKNSPLQRTKGHLVVIKGMTEKGDIIVNDPAASSEKEVERIYDSYEFFRSWIVNKYGTSYFILDDKKIEDVIKIFEEDNEVRYE